MAIRDAVNRNSRKPFAWGGLAGYQQLEAVEQALGQLAGFYPQPMYFQQLAQRVKRALDKNRTLANNLMEAHQFLKRVSACLRYPQSAFSDIPVDSCQVAAEMQALIETYHPDPQQQRPQRAIHTKLQRAWKLFGSDLLPTYDIPGLPPDNLQIESLFGRVRRNQRRVSGRKSTRPLRSFGHYQILFSADSQADLLNHLQTVPLQEYRKHRKLLDSAELDQRFMRRLHRDPQVTLQQVVITYVDRVSHHHISKCDN